MTKYLPRSSCIDQGFSFPPDTISHKGPKPGNCGRQNAEALFDLERQSVFELHGGAEAVRLLLCCGVLGERVVFPVLRASGSSGVEKQ